MAVEFSRSPLSPPQLSRQIPVCGQYDAPVQNLLFHNVSRMTFQENTDIVQNQEILELLLLL
jgi:hypothetical protein